MMFQPKKLKKKKQPKFACEEALDCRDNNLPGGQVQEEIMIHPAAGTAPLSQTLQWFTAFLTSITGTGH